jgi:hypothetical protein
MEKEKEKERVRQEKRACLTYEMIESCIQQLVAERSGRAV